MRFKLVWQTPPGLHVFSKHSDNQQYSSCDIVDINYNDLFRRYIYFIGFNSGITS